MSWRTEISESVRDTLNALRAHDRLSRRGWLRAYNSVHLELPRQIRRFRDKRYPHDPEFFVYCVGFWDRGVWHRFDFLVNDSVQRGLLLVEDVDHEPE